MDKLNPPSWLGRPTLDEKDHNDLEMDSAVNEFGSKMPRVQAEDEAYKKYVEKHRLAAMDHHYDGMKAAAAAGDAESARKHHMMYELHAKALGRDHMTPPDGRDKRDPSKVYRFKAHKGDMYAVQEHEKKPEPTPELSKAQRENLYLLYLGATEVLRKSQDPSEYSEWIESIKGPGHYCHACKAAVPESSKGFNAQKPMPLHQHKKDCSYRKAKSGHLSVVKGEKTGDDCSHCDGEGWVQVDLDGKQYSYSADTSHVRHQMTDEGCNHCNGTGKKKMSKSYDDGTVDKKPAEWHRRDQAKQKLHVNRTNEQFHRNGGYSDAEVKHLSKEGQQRVKERNEAVRREQRSHVRSLKSEMSSKAKHCKCPSYDFPHRHGGGKCKESR